ncbi:MAG: hypothetical protein HFF01_02745 [Erysipelotrichaceae bacterium]|nr:hypothetical protein [Erysipelotrichaceae bacterium]MCI9523955.1 hypothetical protein [Erysipelotrichaceae bacterium]
MVDNQEKTKQKNDNVSMDTKSELEEMKKWADSQKTRKHEKKEPEKKKETPLFNTVKPSQIDTTKTRASQHQSEEKPVKKHAVEKPKQLAAPKSTPKPKQETVKKQESKKKTETAKKPEKKKQPSQPKVSNTNRQSKFSDKRKPNYLLIVSIIIVAVPTLLLLYIVIGSRESSGAPVEGSRFKNALDPKITEEDLNALKSSLTFEQAESVQIHLKSATLRVTINTKDDLSQEDMQALLASAYDKVVEKLPVETYFTNKKSGDSVMKMYDLEVSAYNFIPTEEKNEGMIHISRTKNAAAEEAVDDVLTSPKDEESADAILHPDTTKQPTEGEEGEGQ